MRVSSPTAAAVEETAAGWILDILDLPRASAVGFVTGATVGSFAALAASRSELLRKVGWNEAQDGTFGALEIHVFVGDDVHTSILSALRYLGFGDQRTIRVAINDQGQMDASGLASKVATHLGPKLIIAQAAQINTDAFDPFSKIADIAQAADAWLHVDGAFGLWSRADPEMCALTKGIERADPWVVDGHNWLQVPFDSGYAIVRNADALRDSMAVSASFLPTPAGDDRVPSYLVPELSQRARGLPTWAVLKSLGRNGVIEMVRRHCDLARQMARDLDVVPGTKVMNDVVLNQIILRFGEDADGPEARKNLATTVIERLGEDGAIFFAGAAWRGEWVMRISVTYLDSTASDGHIAAFAIRAAWKAIRAHEAADLSEMR